MNMVTTRIIVVLCLFMFIQISTAINRNYNGVNFDEPQNLVSCINCNISWDSRLHEYIDCVPLDDCPVSVDDGILEAHDDNAVFYNATWLSVRKRVDEGAHFIIVPQEDFNEDYEVGNGTGSEDILGCFLCMAVYVEFNGKKDIIYNYCKDDDCSKYPQYSGQFSWEPVREINEDTKNMLCTFMTIPGIEPTTTHGHCWYDWYNSPIRGHILSSGPFLSSASKVAPGHTLLFATIGFIYSMFIYI
ncbi:uncharacterized protein LOC144436365 [Glandiceps talaboti]